MECILCTWYNWYLRERKWSGKNKRRMVMVNKLLNGGERMQPNIVSPLPENKDIVAGLAGSGRWWIG